MVLYHLEHVDLVPITQTMAAEGLVEHWFVQEDVLATAPKVKTRAGIPSNYSIHMHNAVWPMIRWYCFVISPTI